MTYLQLFLSFLQIGAFSFGGGYAAMPMIQEQVVNVRGWLSIGEFTDLVTISQMTPGPIAVNSATFVGLKIAGLPGAAAATAGCILPSCIMVSGLAFLYLKYRKLTMLQGILNSLRPAVVAMIATAGLTILLSSFFGEGNPLTVPNLNGEMVVFFAAAVWLLRQKHMNPIWVMVLAGVAEVVFTWMKGAVL